MNYHYPARYVDTEADNNRYLEERRKKEPVKTAIYERKIKELEKRISVIEESLKALPK